MRREDTRRGARWGVAGAVAILLAVAMAPVASANEPTAAPRPSAVQEAEVMAVVDAVFDAMRDKDTETLRTLFTEGATLASTGWTPAGEPRIRSTPIVGFIEAVGNGQGYWDEQIWDAEVRVDDNLATVWVKYVFLLDDNLSHCGHNAFQLYRSQDGWKIFHLADSQRREGCVRPPQGA